jgi:uncharacterized protein YbaR (Trm112 family)
MTNHWPLADRGRESGRASSNELALALEPWVVNLLACPHDRSRVRLNGSELVCDLCSRHYPVRAGIPCMLREQAPSEQEF